ncbi:hypothetical protein ABPG72_016236 [Tetrahymena utriculariae]
MEQKQGEIVLEGKYKDFYEFHGVQLYGAGFPAHLVSQLLDKLEKEVFDFTDSFAVQDNQEEETFQSVALENVQKHSKVILIDHQFTFKMEGLRSALESSPELTNKLRYELQYFGDKKNIPGITKSDKFECSEVVEFDEQGIVDPTTLEIQKNVVSLSLFDNQIESLDLVRQVLQKLPALKVLFLNYNPVSETEGFFEKIEEEFPNIELLNSKFTKNTTDFVLKFAHFKYNLDKSSKLKTDMLKQLDLQKKGVFRLDDFTVFTAFKNLIHLDLCKNDFKAETDVPKLLNLLSKCSKLKNLNVDWEVEMLLWDLYEQGKIKEVCPTLMSINDRTFAYGKPQPNEEDIRFIVKNIWKIAGNYRLMSEEQMDETSYWYLNDLCGISVQHSDTPNIRMAPFLYAPNNQLKEAKCYTIMWPLEDISIGSYLFRDYLVGFDETSHRSARLSIWFNVPDDFFIKANQEYKNKLMQITLYGKKYIQEFKNVPAKFVGLNDTLPKQTPLKVITDNSLVSEYLTAPEFQLCNTLEEANIIFLTHCFEETIRDHYMTKFCNQFPEECHIVQKNHLADTVFSILGQVDWIQSTYNLKTQMNEFVGEYKRRHNNLEDNVWIIKAFNLARSLDMIVTDNLDQIIRQTETLPRLAQKYITNPVTLFGKKIDLRYIVSVRSLEPFEVFIYKVFWIRTSNNDFTNDYRSREIYETHFTVMNYGKKLKQIHYDEFIEEFEKEYTQIKWAAIHDKIKTMVKQLFMAVYKKYPGMPHPNCRGSYGMDVMIENGTFQPKLLELTFSPDCERACKYHPHFFNDMFKLFFLNDQEHPHYEKL